MYIVTSEILQLLEGIDDGKRMEQNLLYFISIFQTFIHETKRCFKILILMLLLLFFLCTFDFTY